MVSLAQDVAFSGDKMSLTGGVLVPGLETRRTTYLHWERLDNLGLGG